MGDTFLNIYKIKGSDYIFKGDNCVQTVWLLSKEGSALKRKEFTPLCPTFSFGELHVYYMMVSKQSVITHR